MSYDRCETCGEFGWLDTHKCPPIFYFKHEDWDLEPREVRAHSFSDAAEKFARIYNEDDGDYVLMDEDTEVIISDGNIEKKYIVSAEPDIYYSSREV